MNVDEIYRKYGKKINDQIQEDKFNSSSVSQEYSNFKNEMMPSLSRYERLCNGLGNIIKINISEKDKKTIQKQLDISHLDVTPSQTFSLAVISFLATFFLGALVSVILFLLTNSFPTVLLFLSVVASLFLGYYFYSMPSRMANKFRLKVSSQMVPCILYIVAYMKHTSNLERAIAFAAQHLSPPLALELKKVFWDIETGKYSNIKDSLDNYLETWRDSSIEFIESFHLIESSLYEPSEERRVAVLERALQVILDGVYEKMLSYSREVRGPITNIYMLGIVLPTLAIAMLPLASALLGDVLQAYQIFILFNLIIPFFVFYMTSEILMKRPGGYGEAELLELNPDYPKFKSNKPYVISFLLFFPFILLGFSPFIFNYFNIDFSFSQIGLSFLGDMKFFDFKNIEGSTLGPFGLGSFILGMLIPLGAALFFSMSFKMKTQELIKSREDSQKLEQEFTNSLFQLGNRLGDGMPAEIAFSHVAESTRGQVTEGFFKTVNQNIQQLGMSIEQAIFNPSRGALIYYPSSLISTSMKILIESVKKGLYIAARSLMSISEYIKNIHKINERMRDLLAEVISDMKSNMVFLAPLLSGIVVGLASMIGLILNKLYEFFILQGDMQVEFIGSLKSMMQLFDVTSMIPAYFLQLAIGIYIIEIIFILSDTLVTIDAGEDRLKSVNETGKNLKRGMVLYFIVALIATISLSLLGNIALSGIAG